jgi:ABC-type lipoprotein export system ATPase subunit
MIEVHGLEFAFERGGFRLVVPELTIARGEKVAFVGASGCGKTTLLSLLAGILRPRQGTLRVLGADLNGLGERRLRAFRVARIGFVFQEFELLEYLNVRENIRLPGYINPVLRWGSAKRERLLALAHSVGLAEKLDRYPGELSQGERQRVAICRAFANDPELILADEPTGNLDPANTKHILELLLEGVERHQRTLVMVTHDHSLLRVFDRVIDFEAFATPGGGSP